MGRTPIPDGTVRVGFEADDLEREVTLEGAALGHGCYVGASDSQLASRLLQDWCVQWAEAGLGFCYVHPRGPEPRELVARLPADRLDDVVWVDYRRSNHAAALELPERQRVTIDPLTGPAPEIATDHLKTEPTAGRVADWMAALTESDRQLDWNLARAASLLLTRLIDADELTHHDILRALSSVRTGDQATPLWEHISAPAARTQLEQAVEHDPDAFGHLNQLLGWPFDPFPSNPFLDDPSYAFETAREAGHIVLVTGSMPPRGQTDDLDVPGSHVLIRTVLRRLWEEAQTAAADEPTFPIVVDGAVELTPGDGALVGELCRACNSTPVAPVLRGPMPDQLPRYLSEIVKPHVECRAICSPHASDAVEAAAQTGDIDAIEQALDAESRSAIDGGVQCLVTAGNEGMLTGDPRGKLTTEQAILQEPPRTRHDVETVSETITESVDKHGVRAKWG